MGNSWNGLKTLVPVGISYYTLQAVSYLADVKAKKYPAEHHVLNLALFLSFFSTIMEGPIARYNEIHTSLTDGQPVIYQRLTTGYQRILWDYLKKLSLRII